MADKDKKIFYWIKTDKDFYNSYKIKSLLSEKKGDTYLVIYEQLCCESINYDGQLRYSQNRPYTITELANVINRTPKLLKETLEVLRNKELIDVLDDGTIYMYDVQNRVGSETGKARRMRDYRTNERNCSENVANNEQKMSLEIRDKRLDKRDIEEGIQKLVSLGLYEEVEKLKKYVDRYEPNFEEYKKIEDAVFNYSIRNLDAYVEKIMKGNRYES